MLKYYFYGAWKPKKFDTESFASLTCSFRWELDNWTLFMINVITKNMATVNQNSNFFSFMLCNISKIIVLREIN